MFCMKQSLIGWLIDRKQNLSLMNVAEMQNCRAFVALLGFYIILNGKSFGFG